MQLISLLALVPVVMAQYGGSSSSTTSAAASTSTDGVHVVKVGQNGLTFEPSSMTVPVGDTVEFHFWPAAHSVSQSSFDAPCKPLNATSFFSGAFKVASGMSPFVWRLQVNSTSPLWYYCATGQHCQNGMGGVINPPTSNATRTIENYLAGAKKATANTPQVNAQGGLNVTASTSSPSGSASSSASPSPTGSSSAANKAAVSWGFLGVLGLVGAAAL